MVNINKIIFCVLSKLYFSRMEYMSISFSWIALKHSRNNIYNKIFVDISVDLLLFPSSQVQSLSENCFWLLSTIKVGLVNKHCQKNIVLQSIERVKCWFIHEIVNCNWCIQACTNSYHNVISIIIFIQKSILIKFSKRNYILVYSMFFCWIQKR